MDILPAEWEATVTLHIMKTYILDALKTNTRITSLGCTLNTPTHTSTRMMDYFFEYLAEPAVPDGSWPFPMLANLSLGCGAMCSTALRSMVEKRYQVGNAPRRLQTLDIDNNYQEAGMKEKTCQEISAMLEGTIVLFDGVTAEEVQDGDSDDSYVE